MNERKENNLWCPECKELSRKQFKREPLCERCWPGIHPNNADAWEVYQIARIDEMGLTITGIEASCRILEVNDPVECFVKIRELLSHIQESEPKKEKKSESEIEFPRGKW